MKYRHKKSGKAYSSDAMKKMAKMRGYKAEEYERMDDDDDDDAGKSDLSEDELLKSVEALEEIVESGDRKGQLLAKAQNGELEELEVEELYGLLGGDSAESVSADVLKSLQPAENDEIAKALDVSDYLNASHQASIDALEKLCDHFEKSGTRQHDFNLVLAKSLIEQSKLVLETHDLIKGIGVRLGFIEDQPARPPKSGLTKSDVAERELGGGPPAEDQLSKAEVNDVFSDWIQSGRKTSSAGEPLLAASSKFEQFMQISPSLKAEVEQEIARRRSSAH